MAGNALRELISVFGIRFDATGAKQADKSLDKLGTKSKQAGQQLDNVGTKGKQGLKKVGSEAKKASRQVDKLGNEAQQTGGDLSRVGDTMRTLFGLAAAFGAGRGILGIVNAASDADEAMNVLSASFGESTQDVVNFASATAKEVGRSEFAIRDFAATIGAVASPMFAELGDQADATTAKVSSDFAKLAVDLSSFFNTTEEDSIAALRSGLLGESEPLKRFGVVLLEQNVADFAGITPAQLRKMTQAEKVMLRYQAIMHQTTNAQGDAAKTADGWANMTRRLQGQLRTVAVVAGRRLLGAFQDMAKSVSGLIEGFVKLVENSRIVEGIFAALGVVAVTAALATIGAWGPIVAVMLAVAAIGTVVALVVDDILVAMDGGDSVFGEWIDGLTGVDNATLVLKNAIEGLIGAVADLFAGGGPNLDNYVSAWRNGMADIIDSVISVISPIGKLIEILLRLNPLLGFVLNATNFFGGKGKNALLDSLQNAADSLRTEESSGTQGTRGVGGAGKVARGVARSLAEQSASGTAVAYLPAFDMQSALPPPSIPLRSAGMGAGAMAGGGSSNTSNATNITVNVNANGSSNARDVGREAERGIRQALREERRKVASSVGSGT